MTDKDIRRIVDLEDVDNMIEFGLNTEQKEKAMEYAIEHNKLKILSALVKDFNPENERQENFLFLACQKQNEKALQILCGAQKKWNSQQIHVAYEYAWSEKFFHIIHSLYFLTGQWFERKKG